MITAYQYSVNSFLKQFINSFLSYVRSLFESGPNQESVGRKTKNGQNENEKRVKEAMDMINKMDFTAFKYEESDPVKFNREEVKSLYYAQHFSPPKIVKRNQNIETSANLITVSTKSIENQIEKNIDDGEKVENSVEKVKKKESPEKTEDINDIYHGLKMPKMEDFGLDPNIDYDKWLGLNDYNDSNPKLTGLNPPRPPSIELSPFSSDSPIAPKPEDFGIDPLDSFRLSTGSESTPPIGFKTNQSGPKLKPPNPKDFGIDPNISMTELFGEMPKTTRKSIGTKFIPKIESPLVKISIQSEKAPSNVLEPPKMEDFGIDPTVDISEILRGDTTPTQNPDSRPNSSLDSKPKLPTPIANTCPMPNSSLLDVEDEEPLPSPDEMFTPLRPVLREVQNAIPEIPDGNDSFQLNNVSFDKSLTMEEPGKARKFS